MTNDEIRPIRRHRARTAVAASVLVGGVVAGGVATSALTASAATTPAATSSTSTSAGTGAGTPSTAGTAAPPQAKSSTSVRGDEKVVTGTLATTLKAKALAAVPGGTVNRIETDAGDGVYEAHMTKADGSLVTVKFDAKGNVTKVEDGMGAGDPAPTGARAGAPSGGGSTTG
jgi:hypothetical protein